MRGPRCQRGAAGAAPAPGCWAPAGTRERSRTRTRSAAGRWAGVGRALTSQDPAPGSWRGDRELERDRELEGTGRRRGPGGAPAEAGDAESARAPRSSPAPKVNLLLLSVLFLARYWENFHSCTVTALTDCQEGAKDIWDKLRKESKNLNIQGSLFELCGSGSGAAGSLLPALPVLLASLSAALVTWLSF